MQQHPIPQNVTQYQFRLVGDMTLKQFLELAAGMLVAYLFYASNLIFIFKWPLALISLFGGIAFAFFPLEDRPLDVWALNFVKAIYGPTRFVWKKTNTIPEMFTFAAHIFVDTPTAVKTLKAPTLPVRKTVTSDLSTEEAKQIHEVDALFQKVHISPAVPPVTIVETSSPKPAVTIRKLKAKSIVFNNNAPSPAATPPAPPLHAISIPVTPTPTVAATPTKTPQSPPPTVDVVFSRPTSPTTAPKVASTPLTTIKLPAAPQIPNVITGIVVDKGGHLVENAIVQVVMGDGIPARAMKTNGLGQFFTTTPLGNGSYAIEVEKDGLKFAPQSLTTKGDIIPPILLRATA